jgi:dsRNA-specific ribonuclease
MDNLHNKLISASDVEGILNHYSPIGDNNGPLKVKCVDHYQKAFVHESYYMSVQNHLKNRVGECPNKVYIDYIPDESSERLEYLGDHILKAVMGRYLFERFGNEREGFLTKLKIRLEKTSMLHRFAERLNFREYLLLSTQVEKSGILGMWRGRNVLRNCENAFEAFIGAIMLDNGEDGYKYADRFVRNIIENEIDFGELISCNDNFKDSLQRFYQSNKWKTPEYESINEEGPTYRKIFTRALLIEEEKLQDFPEHIRETISKYSTDTLGYYKTVKIEVYEKLLRHVLDGKLILGVGYGKKVVDAEQDCGRQCLLHLGLSLNY